MKMDPKNRIYKKPFKPAFMTDLCRELRRNQTPAECMLWKLLRDRDFFGHHLRRQAPFGRFIFDFYCAKKKIAIEVDGESHRGKEEYDRKREEFVQGCGIKIIRFSNDDILKNSGDVLKRIEQELNTID